MAAEKEQSSNILQLSFNNDYTLLASGTETGFSVYNIDPLTEKINRELGGGIKLVEVLMRSNLIAIVGGGTNPQYSINKTMIWDDDQKRCIGELNFLCKRKKNAFCVFSVGALMFSSCFLFEI